MVSQDRGIPEDPSDWSEEDIFRVALEHLVEKEGILPRNVAEDMHFSGTYESGSDYNRGGIITVMAAPWLHDYFATNDEAQLALCRLEELLERIVVVE